MRPGSATLFRAVGAIGPYSKAPQCRYNGQNCLQWPGYRVLHVGVHVVWLGALPSLPYSAAWAQVVWGSAHRRHQCVVRLVVVLGLLLA